MFVQMAKPRPIRLRQLVQRALPLNIPTTPHWEFAQIALLDCTLLCHRAVCAVPMEQPPRLEQLDLLLNVHHAATVSTRTKPRLVSVRAVLQVSSPLHRKTLAPSVQMVRPLPLELLEHQPLAQTALLDSIPALLRGVFAKHAPLVSTQSVDRVLFALMARLLQQVTQVLQQSV
jgi:hypothetical protein